MQLSPETTPNRPNRMRAAHLIGAMLIIASVWWQAADFEQLKPKALDIGKHAV